MKALVYQGPNKFDWSEVADPVIIDPTDAIIRVDATTICGSDLHIIKGDLPEVTIGRVLGHEAVGTVQSIGTGVRSLHPGDRVLVSCISSCGHCEFCREARFGLCTGGGGWILGHTVDGTQAELVRVPFADNSTYAMPTGVTDEEYLMLADILPTAYEVGVLNGHISPGDVVAIVGAGPVGLSAVVSARLFSPSQVVVIDLADSRLLEAKKFGADVTINNAREDVGGVIRELTGGQGADVVIEAVGLPATFELASSIMRSGGQLANIGVHGAPATLHLETLWSQDVTITTGLVDTYSTPVLGRLLERKMIDAKQFITHRFHLNEFMEAYKVSMNSADTGALKVVLSRET